MNSREWLAIEQASQVLGLGERATLADIKQAFHRLSKLHHPDTGHEQNEEEMYRITAAYEVLSRYCHEFRFPLRRMDASEHELDIYDPEDWWQARFGQDPVWNEKKNRRR